MAQTTLFNTYNRLPVAFEYGSGVWLYDENDNPYLDAISGIAVNGLGHDHKKLVQTLSTQASKLMHCSNLYHIPAQEKLGRVMNELASMETAFFCNSGAEANEAAIKLARKYGHSKGIEKPTIIVMENAFHGRTLATLSATGNRSVQAGFEPLVSGFVRAPYNDLLALQHILEKNKQICAIMLEPIQGEGGIIIPDPDYLQSVRSLCDQHDLLFILDEVQSGNGRTGKFFAYQHSPILPDIVTTAKGLGNGFPIGACLARGKAAAIFGPGAHGSTFGGNPLACEVALTVIDCIKNDNLLPHATNMGNYLLSQLQETLKHISLVKSIRGKGLMIGIELKEPCADLSLLALDEQLLINMTAAGRVIRLLPPLILQEDEADILISRLCKLLEAREN